MAEGKLHLFLDFNSATRVARLPRLDNDLPYSEHNATPDGFQALVSSVEDFSNDNSLAWLKTKLAKRVPVCSTLDFVAVENIIAPVFVVENELDKTTSLPTTITSYLNMTRWGEIFLSEEWNDNEIGESQLTHMKEVTVEELQFIDDDGDGDAIFLDIETEYL